ncbi:MAG: hypothetical protein M1832_002942 [Thelocarpon impressellum]|nr:MAG: hypothetical protein M1832_002942 [Thelocarpon impressellum]
MAAVSLLDLPDEVIQTILYHVPPLSLPAVHRTSKRLNRLATEPLLWRHHCQTQFRYWDQRHKIREKFAGSALAVDWKDVFVKRVGTDRRTTELLDGILSSQTGRIDKFQSIVGQGYDVKDTLLRHLNVGDEADDVLARRYYSDAVLGSLHRTMAIDVWRELSLGVPGSLERCLAAFDMFVLRDREGDLDEVSSALDRLAQQFREANLGERDLKVRERALALARFLRANDLTGVESQGSYHDLKNNFIGFALRHQKHPSLPLISVAILCALAERLDIDARPCGYPFHVYAVVYPPSGSTLDGRPTTEDVQSERMYLDPFRSQHETQEDDLRAQLTLIGIAPTAQNEYLGGASIAEMILRSAHNLMHSVQEATPRMAERRPVVHDASSVDVDSALYASLWAALALYLPENLNVQRRQYLQFIMSSSETLFPEDVSLVERYILPSFRELPQYPVLLNAIRATRASDAMAKQPCQRTGQTSNEHVKYKVGQVFMHRRYSYAAVITGWDAKCKKDEPWLQQMQVDRLPGGRHQSFYHVLYVAEENIEIIRPRIPSAIMMQLAGKHFKRWDATTATFVSNIRDEYPDD